MPKAIMSVAKFIIIERDSTRILYKALQKKSGSEVF